MNPSKIFAFRSAESKVFVRINNLVWKVKCCPMKISRPLKSVICVLTVEVILALSMVLASLFIFPADFSRLLNLWLPYLIDAAVVFVFLIASGLHAPLFSLMGMGEMMRISLMSLLVLAVNLIQRAICQPFPFRFTFLSALFFLIGTAIFYFSFRIRNRIGLYLQTVREKSFRSVIIIGAGVTGGMLANEMIRKPEMKMHPVCFLDDDPLLRGAALHGIKIEGPVAEIEDVAQRYHPDLIVVAIPSASAKALADIYRRCGKTGVEVKTMPGYSQLLTGEISATRLRSVDVNDLLGREEIHVNMDEIQECISGKVVLVTGGGGSIGSELCRQIASYRPDQLIIFDIYENNAYDIEQELRRTHPELNLLTLIGSVRDKGRVEDLFATYHPQIVFNAAAHKHVPLMETSPNEAVKNNVFGTLNVALAADKFGAEKFVQISTDKAVNPTNVMGATKRICEMIIQTIGQHSKHTNFVAVRFGNVLGSNGSVIPLFKKQIEAGGPVTVTDKNIVRYFMTIPEAVSLVLQACCYAKAGEIYVFDMGDPVRIYDLAVNLIRLSGYTPGVDIEIRCTGLRPGEKLYEERLMDEEGMERTANDKISIGKPLNVDEASFFQTLERLREAAYAESDRMKYLVRELVPTYHVDETYHAPEAVHVPSAEGKSE